MTSRREYYSVRTGKASARKLDLSAMQQLFFCLYKQFERNGYLCRSFGHYCVDDSSTYSGTAGDDIVSLFFLKLRKQGLCPIDDHYKEYSEEDLFDVIELLYDHITKPNSLGRRHGFCEYAVCRFDIDSFDDTAGQAEFRDEINRLLVDYGEGWEINAQGVIVSLGDHAFRSLLCAQVPHYDAANVDQRIADAVERFRSRRVEERRVAVKTLADVLEFLRPKVKTFLLPKDEGELFNIANNFQIRHHNPAQKSDYDAVWLGWIFYVYLATIHVVVRLLKRQESSS